MMPAPPPGFELLPGTPAPSAGVPPPPPGFVVEAPAAPPPAAVAGAARPDLYSTILGGQEAVPVPPVTTGDMLADMAKAVPGGIATGFADLLGAPADLASLLPKPIHTMLFPGDAAASALYGAVFGEEPTSPIGGSETFKAAAQAPVDAVNAVAGTDIDLFRRPETMPGRFVHRVGQEVGALVPILGMAGKAARGTRALEEMSPLARYFVEPMRVNPVGTTARELQYATASGLGAQAANEVFTPGGEGNVYSDVGGSFAGAAGLAGASGALGVLRNLYAGATNSPKYMDSVAGQAVVDQIIDRSSMMGAQAEPDLLAGRTPRIDTAPLAAQLRQPAPVEQAVPGYTADIGVRSQDPMLQVLTQDANARRAGFGAQVRSRNNEAVNARVGELAPQGNPGQFRLDLQSGVDDQIASLVTEEDLARAAFDEAFGVVQPQMAGPAARGAGIRTSLQDVYDQALSEVGEMYRAIDEGGYQVDMDPLAQRFAAVDQRLPVNDQMRFRPTEADTPSRVMAERAGSAQPGTDLAFPGQGPQEPPLERVPLREATAIRSGLSNDVQAATRRGEPRQASIARQYRDELDRFLAEELDPEASAALQGANRARFEVGQRFEDRGAIPETLARTERGDYRLPDEAVPRQYVQKDTGRVSDFQALLREAGDDPRAREAVADQVLEDAQPYLKSPDKLRSFLGERGVVLSAFPEVRAKLEDAGAKLEGLNTAAAERTTRQRDLTTPGRSPEASYLRYGDDRVRDSVRTVVNAADPRAAARRLIETSGGNATDLRAALWEEVKGQSRNSATAADGSGADVWNPRKARDLFNDPKFSAVAEELWKDDPEDLASIREVFSALEAATPGRQRAPGSSGTAQSLTGKLDPSMTAASLSSRVRSVHRGQMSPVIAAIDVMSVWLRNKSAQVQAGAIDSLLSQVVNNPGLAADLLDEFNPATWAAKRRMLTQKYGARIGQVLTILDEMNAEPETEDDEIRRAVE